MSSTLATPALQPGDATADSSVFVDVQNLSIAYRDARGRAIPAVENVSFQLHRGVRYGLVGESGSGKSTVARSLLGLMRPPAVVRADRMEVAGVGSLVGADRRTLARLRGRTVAYIPQNPFGALHPVLSVGDQFHRYFVAHRATTGWAETHAKARAALWRLGIVDPDRVLLGHAGALSGGMAQRVVIALSSSLHPGLIVADEPTTALDVTVQKQVLDLLAPVHTADRHALLLTTHDLGVVAQYCDEVFVMLKGSIVERGTVQDVFLRPQHPYTQKLIAAVPKKRDPTLRRTYSQALGKETL